MSRACLVIGVLLGSTLLASAGEPRWFQIPASDVWVDVPQPWKVRADARAPRLHVQDGTGARFELIAPQSRAESAFATRLRTLATEFEGLKWRTKTATAADGSANINEQPVHLAVRARELKGRTLVVTAAAPTSTAHAMGRLAQGLTERVSQSWRRPGGIHAALPSTPYRVRVLEGWNPAAQPTHDMLRIRRDDGAAQLELRFDARPETSPSSALAEWARMVGGDLITWDEPAPWTPGAKAAGQDGLQQLGRTKGESATYSWLVAWPVPGGHVVAVARGALSGLDATLAQLREMVRSLR